MCFCVCFYVLSLCSHLLPAIAAQGTLSCVSFFPFLLFLPARFACGLSCLHARLLARAAPGPPLLRRGLSCLHARLLARAAPGPPLLQRRRLSCLHARLLARAATSAATTRPTAAGSTPPPIVDSHHIIVVLHVDRLCCPLLLVLGSVLCVTGTANAALYAALSSSPGRYVLAQWRPLQPGLYELPQWQALPTACGADASRQQYPSQHALEQAPQTASIALFFAAAPTAPAATARPDLASSSSSSSSCTDSRSFLETYPGQTGLALLPWCPGSWRAAAI
jgi:hypothetical protein